jgi:hypothetical protein
VLTKGRSKLKTGPFYLKKNKMVSISVISASVAILKMFLFELGAVDYERLYTNVYINTILQIRKFLANATGYVNQPVFPHNVDTVFIVIVFYLSDSYHRLGVVYYWTNSYFVKHIFNYLIKD